MFLFLFWQAGKTAKFNNKIKNNANCSSSLIHWREVSAQRQKQWGRGFCLFSFHLPFCQFGVWRAVTLYYLKKQKMQN